MATPSALPSPALIEQLIAVDPAIIRGYSRGVADELTRGPLTLDRRDRLLSRAKHLGLGRFEAALILAVAERETPVTVSRIASTTTYTQAERVMPKWPVLGVAAAMQVAIVAAAWWFVF